MKKESYLEAANNSMKKGESYKDSKLYIPNDKCSARKKVTNVNDIFEELMLYCHFKKHLYENLNQTYKTDEALSDPYIPGHARVEKAICKNMYMLRDHPNGHRGFPDAILRYSRLPIEIKTVDFNYISNPRFDFKKIFDYIVDTYTSPMNLFTIYDINYYETYFVNGNECTKIIGNTVAPIWDLTGPMKKDPNYMYTTKKDKKLRPVNYWNMKNTFNSPYIFVHYVAETAKAIVQGNIFKHSGHIVNIDQWEKRMRCTIYKYIDLCYIYRANLFSDIPLWQDKKMEKMWRKIFDKQQKCTKETVVSEPKTFRPYEKFSILDITENKTYASVSAWIHAHKFNGKTWHNIQVRVDAHLHDRVETCYGHLLQKIPAIV